jgi:predicted 2-oxoglutarate/Fe(II)-dependent dioxygenase YbiX
MSAGRNDACPCGSGKKYKKCCLPAMQARESRNKALRHVVPEDEYRARPAGSALRLLRPIALPWLPTAGDLAPSWVGVDATGFPAGSDLQAGRAALLCFVPGAASPFLAGLAARKAALDATGARVTCFVDDAAASPRPFPVALDLQRVVTDAYCRSPGAASASPRAVLVDGDGRILDAVDVALADGGAEAALDLASRHAPFAARLARQAPVLEIPGVLDPEMCRRLILAWEEGKKVEGTSIRLLDGKATSVVDPTHKRRRDHRLEGELRATVWSLFEARLVPAVRRAFAFDITRYEYIQVGCYSADEEGHFGKHRDNGSALSAHRRFAVSLNLNDDFEGGLLRFPEHGNAEYRPAPGTAVVFSCSLLHEATPVTRGRRFMLVAQFWGEAEVTLREEAQRVEASGAPAAGEDQRASRAQLLVEDARLLREIAGDVRAFGAELARVPSASARLEAIHRELTLLRDELGARRPEYLREQRRRLPPAESGLKLHLGCGGHKLAGWVNVDSTGGDLAMDLRWPLPFRDGSVRYAFASHMVEHLYRATELPRFLEDVRRVLEPGGVFRVIVPDIEKCLRAYVAGDARFFEERKKTWAWAAACKTHLDHFLAYAGANQALEGFGGHKYAYDFETLSVALRDAGFEVERSDFMASRHEALRIDTASSNASASANGVHYSLFVEATKPLAAR